MTLPTQTFRVSTTYAVTMAGSFLTQAETLAAVNQLLTAETALGGLWGVSHYDPTAGTLEIKRNGSPAGTLGTFRALMFGKVAVSPSAAAVATPGGGRVFVGVSEDAASTGPGQSFTVGIPYPGKKWTVAGTFLYSSGGATITTTTPSMYLIESDEMCAITLFDDTGSHFCLFGACVEALPEETKIWAVFTSGGDYLNTASQWGNNGVMSPTNPGGSWFLPLSLGASTSTNGAWGAWHDGTNTRYLTRTVTPSQDAVDDDPFSNNNSALLLPIPLADKVYNVTEYPRFRGQLRQLRYGPRALNKSRITDASSALVAHHVSAGRLVARPGLFFDVLP